MANCADTVAGDFNCRGLLFRRSGPDAFRWGSADDGTVAQVWRDGAAPPFHWCWSVRHGGSATTGFKQVNGRKTGRDEAAAEAAFWVERFGSTG